MSPLPPSPLVGFVLAVAAFGVLHDGGIPGEAAVVPSRGAPVHLDEGPGVGEPGLGEFRIRQDTVVPVSPGDVFVSETLRGTLIVRAGGDEVRLSGDQDELPILVREGSTVRLRPRRGARDADVLLELPVWMPLSIRSRDLDVWWRTTRRRSGSRPSPEMCGSMG